jgi:signal transduction histidine kinase
LQPQADRKEIQITKNFFGERSIVADVGTVELSVRNLVANAIKFTPKGGKITVTVAADEHELNISVADNGVGMPPEVAKNILKNNKGYTTLGTNAEKGTGLGLQLCKTYIEKCGGTIQVVSEEGSGTKFSFSIPLTDWE